MVIIWYKQRARLFGEFCVAFAQLSRNQLRVRKESFFERNEFMLLFCPSNDIYANNYDPSVFGLVESQKILYLAR